MSNVALFPLRRRLDTIRERSGSGAEDALRRAEAALRRQLPLQRQCMLAQGVDSAVVDQHMRFLAHQLHSAVDATLEANHPARDGAA